MVAHCVPRAWSWPAYLFRREHHGPPCSNTTTWLRRWTDTVAHDFRPLFDRPATSFAPICSDLVTQHRRINRHSTVGAWKFRCICCFVKLKTRKFKDIIGHSVGYFDRIIKRKFNENLIRFSDRLGAAGGFWSCEIHCVLCWDGKTSISYEFLAIFRIKWLCVLLQSNGTRCSKVIFRNIDIIFLARLKSIGS